MSKKFLSVNFEVFGAVQGVFFRKYARQEARRLDLKGWCMNTKYGTVTGVIQGDPTNVDEMKTWLRSVGSPQSKIQDVEFADEEIENIEFQDFKVKRSVDSEDSHVLRNASLI